jgi:hypothetical protein
MTTKGKIRALENHVLPTAPEPAKFIISSDLEQELATKAREIRRKIALNFDAEKVWNDDSLTLEQKGDLTLDAVKDLSPADNLILDKDLSFMGQRLFSIIEQFYEPQFPKNAKQEMMLHIGWFLIQMGNLGLKEHIIHDEWTHNRNEDDPNFDDFAWWKRVDALIKKSLPDGVFTAKSLRKLREWFDKKESEFILKYWDEHPEEYERFMDDLHKRTEEITKHVAPPKLPKGNRGMGDSS